MTQEMRSPRTMVTFSRRGLHGDVVDTLGRKVVQGELAPGEVIDVDSLEHEFAVSRSVVREAIRALAAKGLVDARPKHGTFVRDRSNWSLLDPDVLAWQADGSANAGLLIDLEEVRRIVEPQAARLASLRHNAHDLAAMEETLDRLANATRRDPGVRDYAEADVGFHSAILAASRNEILLQLTPVLEHALRLRDSLVYGGLGGLDHAGTVAAHRAVLEAIASGDTDAAEARTRLLLSAASSDLETLLKTQEKAVRRR